VPEKSHQIVSKSSVEMLEGLASKGHVDSLYRLGEMYYEGKGTKRNLLLTSF
jgi:TPR repeat protein